MPSVIFYDDIPPGTLGESGIKAAVWWMVTSSAQAQGPLEQWFQHWLHPGSPGQHKQYDTRVPSPKIWFYWPGIEIFLKQASQVILLWNQEWRPLPLREACRNLGGHQEQEVRGSCKFCSHRSWRKGEFGKSERKNYIYQQQLPERRKWFSSSAHRWQKEEPQWLGRMSRFWSLSGFKLPV